MTTGIGKIILYKVTGGEILMIMYIVVSFKNLQRCDNDALHAATCCVGGT